MEHHEMLEREDLQTIFFQEAKEAREDLQTIFFQEAKESMEREEC